MNKTLKAALWTVAIVLCISTGAYFAGCGSDDSSADTGGGGSAEIDQLNQKYGCSSSPTDQCKQTICSILQGATAMASAPGFQDGVKCYTDLAACLDDACPSGQLDATKWTACLNTYYKCMCAVESLKQYMGSYCATAD